MVTVRFQENSQFHEFEYPHGEVMGYATIKKEGVIDNTSYTLLDLDSIPMEQDHLAEEVCILEYTIVESYAGVKRSKHVLWGNSETEGNLYREKQEEVLSSIVRATKCSFLVDEEWVGQEEYIEIEQWDHLYEIIELITTYAPEKQEFSYKLSDYETTPTTVKKEELSSLPAYILTLIYRKERWGKK